MWNTYKRIFKITFYGLLSMFIITTVLALNVDTNNIQQRVEKSVTKEECLNTQGIVDMLAFFNQQAKKVTSVDDMLWREKARERLSDYLMKVTVNECVTQEKVKEVYYNMKMPK